MSLFYKFEGLPVLPTPPAFRVVLLHTEMKVLRLFGGSVFKGGITSGCKNVKKTQCGLWMTPGPAYIITGRDPHSTK